MRLYSLFLLLIAGCSTCRANPIDNTTVSEFDINRYMGKWYEVARIDNRYQRNLTAVTAEYRLDGDNRIAIINRGYNSSNGEWREIEARGETTSTVGRLKVSFFLFVTSEYNVMDLGDDYEWALVGSKSSKFLWIISRTPSLPNDTLNHIISIAQRRGYNIEDIDIHQYNNIAQSAP